MYRIKITHAGDYMMIQKHAAISFGAPGKKRKKRMSETKEAQKKNNQKKKAEKLQLLMLMNFNKGYHVVLRYPKGNQGCTYREAEKKLASFLDKTRRQLKASGRPFKFIAITERGKRREALHHHMVIPDDPDLLTSIRKNWGNNFEVISMYEEGAYKELAEYFVKVETKEEAEKGKSKYHRSRNLQKPLEKSAITTKKWQEEPEIPKGYELVKDSFESGKIEALGGLPYQKYMVKRSGKKEKAKPAPKEKGILKKIFGKAKSLLGGRRAP